MKIKKLLGVVLANLGFCSLIGTIALRIMAFWDIFQQGYFIAVEQNPAILHIEIFLTVYATVFLIYSYLQFLRSYGKKRGRFLS